MYKYPTFQKTRLNIFHKFSQGNRNPWYIYPYRPSGRAVQNG